MKIQLNNRPENIDAEQLSVQELLTIKKFTFKLLVIKINGKLIKRGNYDKAFIQNGDDVAVIHMISGG